MIRSAMRNRALAVVFGGMTLLSAGPAFAEEPIETAIRAWVSTLDASPNWVAGFSELSYDEPSRTATLKNLSIRSETLSTKMEVTFATITVTGYSQMPDGGFGAVEIRADEARAVVGEIFDIKQATTVVKNLTVPTFTGFAFDQTKVFTSLVKAYGIFTKASMDSFRSDRISVDQTYEGQKSVTTIEAYELAGMKDGMINLATMGPMVQDSPSPDGLVKLRIEKIEAHKYDLGAIVDVLDPDRYVGGVGDGKWRTALALEAYRNMTIGIPGGEVWIGAFELENFKVRQPSRSPAPLFDTILANPNMSEAELGKLAIDYMPSFLSWFGFGSFRMSDLDVVAPEIDRFHLGDFHINELSSDGLGEIGIGDLDLAVQDKGSVGAERLAVGGFVFPSMDRVVAAIKASEAGLEADPLPLIPTMGYAEAVNLDVAQAGKKVGAIDRGRLDLKSYIGPVPTEIALDLRGLDLDLSMVDDPQARRMIQGLGYDRLNADYGFKLHWREADESLLLDDFKLAIKDVGALTADIALSGLKRATIENPLAIETALPSLLFSRGKVVVEDRSVVGRAIEMEAKKKSQTPEKFREDIAGATPFTLMLLLKNPGFQAKLAPALQAFIRTPGTLTLTAAPATPVPILALIQAADSDPRSLPDLLSLDVQASK